MKHLILLLLLAGWGRLCSAQSVDSIFVDLYTDSLIKGTFNYININGRLPNGRYLPLDSTQLLFSASAGSFSGNSLWIDDNFREDKVTIKAALRSNPSLFKQFDIYIKKNPFTEKLKTADEIMNKTKSDRKTKKSGN